MGKLWLQPVQRSSIAGVNESCRPGKRHGKTLPAFNLQPCPFADNSGFRAPSYSLSLDIVFTSMQPDQERQKR